MTPVPPGELLPGRTARWWQHMMFVGVGLALGFLSGVFLTAPAFHPSESSGLFALGVADFAALFLSMLLAMVARNLCQLKYRKEKRAGYTTIRSAVNIQVRDSHGAVIPVGDKRLTNSSQFARIWALVAAACVVIVPVIWILRTIIGVERL